MDLTLKNYRPVSNLSYLSKLIERIVYSRIVTEAHKSGNMEPFQSAYHEGHSIETALLKVKTDILNVVDNTEVICLALLDLSTAFNTVNHSLLLNRQKFHFGFTDIVLKWVSQYLSGRSQRVIIDGVEGQPQGQSDYMTLNQGILRVWCLDPSCSHYMCLPLGTFAIIVQSTFMVMWMTAKSI